LFLQQAQSPSGIAQLLPFVLIIGIFYVVWFLPTRNQQKKLQELIKNLKVGDKIVTSGGIYGTIVGLRGERIQVRLAENVKVEMARNAVTALQLPEEE
jgi:preprotein translocase subunit YajC